MLTPRPDYHSRWWQDRFSLLYLCRARIRCSQSRCLLPCANCPLSHSNFAATLNVAVHIPATFIAAASVLPSFFQRIHFADIVWIAICNKGHFIKKQTKTKTFTWYFQFLAGKWCETRTVVISPLSLNPLTIFLNKFTVPLCRHPEWCACKETWTEFFIIGLWDLQSLLSNQVHMPIVMDSAVPPLSNTQTAHTYKSEFTCPTLSWSINIYSCGEAVSASSLLWSHPSLHTHTHIYAQTSHSRKRERGWMRLDPSLVKFPNSVNVFLQRVWSLRKNCPCGKLWIGTEGV